VGVFGFGFGVWGGGVWGLGWGYPDGRRGLSAAGLSGTSTFSYPTFPVRIPCGMRPLSLSRRDTVLLRGRGTTGQNPDRC